MEEARENPASDENRRVNNHSTNNHNKTKKPSGFFVSNKFENIYMINLTL
tara:strand:- start:179 stop:328 length:150 start_codon:yes stop_codon:yes gene_type:complete